MDTSAILQAICLVLLLVGSAFFSSAETALTTVNRIQIQLLAEEDNKKAKRVEMILDQSSKMLSAILIGNNIVNISASALATTLTISVFGNAYVGLATGILTLLVLVLGEITPKSLASIFSLQLSLAYSGFIWMLMRILTPVIFVVEAIRTGILKLMGVDPNAKGNRITEDELKTLVEVVSYVENICRSFQLLANNKIRLNFTSSVSQLLMEFDVDKLGKIVNNLLSNAYKFTPDHGSVTVSLSVVKELVINGSAKDVLQIQVADTGKGISD